MLRIEKDNPSLPMPPARVRDTAWTVKVGVMPMAKSTKSNRRNKSAKPYDGFPLTAHPSGRWCKKHRGKQHYFGRIDDWQGRP